MERISDIGRRAAQLAALAFAVLAPVVGDTARAAPPETQTAALLAFRPTSAPIGWVQFCRDNPIECGARPARLEAVVLDDDRMDELADLNRAVNRAVAPMSDIDQYGRIEHWAYPDAGYGDCEDYVLEKKRRLVARGWPASALLVTVVRDRNGDGHAVLTVVTAAGDLILDNHVDAVLPWAETGYAFVKRQSAADPNRWVTIGPASTPPAVASR